MQSDRKRFPDPLFAPGGRSLWTVAALCDIPEKVVISNDG
jgi:hypothetical protein